MFKREVKSISDILQQFLRKEGLETPLQQKRLVDAWESVTGEIVARYTQEKFIKNQILYVKITNPALRKALSKAHPSGLCLEAVRDAGHNGPDS